MAEPIWADVPTVPPGMKEALYGRNLLELVLKHYFSDFTMKQIEDMSLTEIKSRLRDALREDHPWIK